MEAQTLAQQPLPKNRLTPITELALLPSTLSTFNPDLIPLEKIYPSIEMTTDLRGEASQKLTYESRMALVAVRRQIVEKVHARRQQENAYRRHAAQRDGIIIRMREEGDQLPKWQLEDLRARAEQHATEMALCIAMREQLRMECWVLYTALVDDGKG